MKKLAKSINNLADAIDSLYNVIDGLRAQIASPKPIRPERPLDEYAAKAWEAFEPGSLYPFGMLDRDKQAAFCRAAAAVLLLAREER